MNVYFMIGLICSLLYFIFVGYINNDIDKEYMDNNFGGIILVMPVLIFLLWPVFSCLFLGECVYILIEKIKE